MAAEMISADGKVPSKSTSDKTNKIGRKNSEMKSKRERYQNNDEPSELQCIIAKQLSDYLDRNIEDVAVDNQDDNTVKEEGQTDELDFQLFSPQLRCYNVVDSSTSKHHPKWLKKAKNKKADIIDSSGSDDDCERNARLKEAAISAEDILHGSAFW